MSASPVRIQANRANALKSTGPRTAHGKLRSSVNALRHGLTSKMVILPDEDLQTYQTFRDNFFEDLQPRGMVEEQLAFTLVNAQWRLNRCRAFEQSILTAEPESTTLLIREQVESLSKLSLYEQRLTRIFQTTLKQFRDLQADRKEQEHKAMQDAARLLKHCRSKEIAFDPAALGFVFSIAEIEIWQHRHDQMEAANRASMTTFNRHVLSGGR